MKYTKLSPAETLFNNRDKVVKISEKFPIKNLRFLDFPPRGSFAKGPNEIHFIVDPLEGCTLFDLGDLEDALQPILRKKVYVRTELCIPFVFRGRFLAAAQMV
jgi:predicted nucleotidyltransferase